MQNNSKSLGVLYSKRPNHPINDRSDVLTSLAIGFIVMFSLLAIGLYLAEKAYS